MSKIKVNPNLVLKANQKLAKSRETVKSQLMPVKAAHSHLDRRILARRGINGQFNNVHKQFQEIEEKIDTLYNFILHSMQQYSIAEETVNKRVVENNLGTFAIANTLGNTPNYDKMQPSDTPDKKDGSSFSKKINGHPAKSLYFRHFKRFIIAGFQKIII